MLSKNDSFCLRFLAFAAAMQPCPACSGLTRIATQRVEDMPGGGRRRRTEYRDCRCLDSELAPGTLASLADALGVAVPNVDADFDDEGGGR